MSARRVCRTCGLPRHDDGRHAFVPIPVTEVPALAGVREAIASVYRLSRALEYPAAGLLEAESFHTGIPRPLLEIAFAHQEADRDRRDGVDADRRLLPERGDDRR